MELLLIRHGSTPGNLLGQYVGSIDQPLAPEGEALARERRALMPEIDRLWVSPMRRCVQTAALLFPNMEQHPVPQLTECNFGKFEGRTWEELKDNPVFQAWVAGDPNVVFPGGERLGHHLKRCQDGVAAVVKEAEALGIRRAGIVAHGGTLMSAMSAFALPHKGYYSWLPKNCGGYLVSVKENPLSFTVLQEI